MKLKELVEMIEHVLPVIPKTGNLKYIAQDQDGSLWGFEKEPRKGVSTWGENTGKTKSLGMYKVCEDWGTEVIMLESGIDRQIKIIAKDIVKEGKDLNITMVMHHLNMLKELIQNA